MGMPTNGSPEEIEARGLSNRDLAFRIEGLVVRRRGYNKPLADAMLTEAARRLRWTDAYDNHKENTP